MHRQPAPDLGGSCTGSHYDWLAWHGNGLQVTGACKLQAPRAYNYMATQNGVDVLAISYLAIGFPLFWN